VQQADVQIRDFLDFDDFKRFVKLLKARPEVKRLYKKLCLLGEGRFSFQTFERFMRDHQKVSERTIWLLEMFLTFSQVRCKRRRIEATLSPLCHTFSRQRGAEDGPNPARRVSG
jgi:hypothetical protein